MSAKFGGFFLMFNATARCSRSIRGVWKKLGRFRLCAAMLVLATSPTAAFADSDLDDCQSDNSAVSIPACTKMIDSGNESGEFLGTLYGLRALGYVRAGDFAKAIPDLTATIERGSGNNDMFNNGDILNLRAVAYFYSGDSPHAIADYTENIRKQPDDMAAHNGRGFIYLTMKNYDAALADYDAALKVKPDNAQSLYGRGLAKRAKGDGAGAQKDMAKAKELMPDVADGFIRAGVDSKP